MLEAPAASSLTSRALRHKSFVVGGVLTLLLAAAALLSLLWTPYPVAEINIPANNKTFVAQRA
jgi:peptide/nickel transport system permease protein